MDKIEHKFLNCSQLGVTSQLLKISLSLMLSSLSYVVMLFCDRLLLAKYSIAALNAVVVAGTFPWILIEPFRVLASMAEIFVAQYNGANKKREVARPVWQMIWFSLGSGLLCLACGFWFVPLIFSDPAEIVYSSLLLIFSFMPILAAALSAFYIGRGHVKLIVLVSLISNVVNLLLDIVLIFGIDGLIPSLGVKGAAIATNIGFLVQILILLVMFLNKQNRHNYSTDNFYIDFYLLKKCLRIGVPMASIVFVEIGAIFIFYEMLTAVSIQHVTIATIWHSIIIMFYFIGEGVNQGAGVVAGNFIGAKKYSLIPEVIKSGLKIYTFPFILIFSALVFYPDFFIDMFLAGEDEVIINAEARASLKWCLIFEGFILAFIWIRMLIGGVLSAAGDTLFQLFTVTLLTVFFFLLPVYLLVIKGSAEMEIVGVVIAIESFFVAALFYYRYRHKHWEHARLIGPG